MSDIIEITDFEDPKLDVYARIKEIQLLNRANPEDGIFIAESPKVVERALDAGYEPISILVEKKHVEGEAKQIIKRCGQIPVYTAEFDVLTKITGFKLTRGMLCAMHRRKLPSMREICENAKRIAVLEEVVNPTNIGAIFRSAAAMHMDAVLLTPACSNPLYRRAIRVSMGTVFQIPWTFVDNSVSWPEGGIQLLHKMGFKMAALALSGDSNRRRRSDIPDDRRLRLHRQNTNVAWRGFFKCGSCKCRSILAAEKRKVRNGKTEENKKYRSNGRKHHLEPVEICGSADAWKCASAALQPGRYLGGRPLYRR